MPRKAVLPGVIGNTAVSTFDFCITSYSLDGGYNFINVAGYGGPGCEEFIQGLLRTGVVLRGYLTKGDPNLIPTRGVTCDLYIETDPTGGPTGNSVRYVDTVLPGPFSLVGAYAGVNEYSLTVGHAAGLEVGPKALRS